MWNTYEMRCGNKIITRLRHKKLKIIMEFVILIITFLCIWLLITFLKAFRCYLFFQSWCPWWILNRIQDLFLISSIGTWSESPSMVYHNSPLLIELTEECCSEYSFWWEGLRGVWDRERGREIGRELGREIVKNKKWD